MKSYIIRLFLPILICFIIIFGFNENRKLILERLVYYKFILNIYDSYNDKIYDFNLFINGKNDNYPTYKVNTSKKNYIKLQNQIRDTYQNFVTTGNQFQGSETKYSSIITDEYGNESKSQIYLFGMNSDHFRNPNGHSFRVKHKGDLFFGKKKQNFLKPITRAFGLDHIWNSLFHKVSNGIKINYKPVKLVFNNIDYGFYYIEPFFDKYLIEENGFRDGEIFEVFKDSIKLNHIPKEKVFSDFQNANVNDLIKMADYQKLYDIVALSILSGSSHAILDFNLHWYHNPIINKIQPLLREIGAYDINLTDIESISFNELVASYVDYNFLINTIYKRDKDFFTLKVEESINKFLIFFEGDKILKDKSVVSFLNDNPSNRKLYKYYNLIKSNIDLIKPKISSGSSLKIKRDSIIIDQNLNFSSDKIFRNKIFVIKEGVKLNIQNNSLLFFENCEVIFKGKNKPINITGKGNNSGSFFFKESNVIFDNVNFSNIQSPIKKSIVTPASITFYESNVNINNCSFKKNISGDDYLNFFRCKNVDISKSTFEKIISDAIDSDFSNISVSQSRFSDIGNDAIDLSGSLSKIINCSFYSVGDKCISIGEKTNIFIEQNKFFQSEIAVVIKDGSSINSSLNSFIKNKLDYVAFVKKPSYGPPIVKIINDRTSARILIDKEINLSIDKHNNLLETKLKNVESILYGKKFGRASK